MNAKNVIRNNYEGQLSNALTLLTTVEAELGSVGDLIYIWILSRMILNLVLNKKSLKYSEMKDLSMDFWVEASWAAINLTLEYQLGDYASWDAEAELYDK